MARGTIAENARRQLSLINRCQMPRNVKRDWRFMGHRIYNHEDSGPNLEREKGQSNKPHFSTIRVEASMMRGVPGIICATFFSESSTHLA